MSVSELYARKRMREADVAARVPSGGFVYISGNAATPRALLEAMIHSYLDRSDLRGDWVHDVIAAWPLSSSAFGTQLSR